jgi:TonB family protein
MIRLTSVLLCLALAGCASGPSPQEGPSSGQAVPRYQTKPRYPKVLQEAGMQGCVVVSFAIREDGRAEQYKVEDSVPAGMFDQSAIASLTEWRFEQPARPGRYAQLLSYRLDGPNVIKQQRECRPVPAFEELNPGAAKS